MHPSLSMATQNYLRCWLVTQPEEWNGKKWVKLCAFLGSNFKKYISKSWKPLRLELSFREQQCSFSVFPVLSLPSQAWRHSGECRTYKGAWCRQEHQTVGSQSLHSRVREGGLGLAWKPQGKDKRRGRDRKMYLRSTSSNQFRGPSMGGRFQHKDAAAMPQDWS